MTVQRMMGTSLQRLTIVAVQRKKVMSMYQLITVIMKLMLVEIQILVDIEPTAVLNNSENSHNNASVKRSVAPTR